MPGTLSMCQHCLPVVSSVRCGSAKGKCMSPKDVPIACLQHIAGPMNNMPSLNISVYSSCCSNASIRYSRFCTWEGIEAGCIHLLTLKTHS